MLIFGEVIANLESLEGLGIGGLTEQCFDGLEACQWCERRDGREGRRKRPRDTSARTLLCSEFEVGWLQFHALASGTGELR